MLALLALLALLAFLAFLALLAFLDFLAFLIIVIIVIIVVDEATRLAPHESRLRAFVRLTWRSFLVLAIAGAFGAWLLHWGSRSRRKADDTASAPIAVPAPEQHTWSPRRVHEPAPGCKPRAGRICNAGDAWWVDSCAEVNELAQECGAARCSAGVCEAETPNECGDVTPLGSCRRDVARVCQQGKLFEVDCATSGGRCVMTTDGPGCHEKSADACRDGEPPTCDGRVLRRCYEGTWERLDCEALAGVCVPGSRDVPARCAFALPILDADCGPCGCPPQPEVEICDGKDNDRNGVVDDGTSCAPVPIVAFVVTGGDASHSDEDIATAIEETNTAFARDDGLELVFELHSIVHVDDEDLAELDSEDLDRLLRTDRLVGAAEDFYIPVVFTDVVLAAKVPRPGLSTVPNGVCGGVRRIWDRQPAIGLVAVAKRRWPTTLAHELGHFLGLCHTHEAPAPVVQVHSGGELGDAATCDGRCEGGADGICDTTIDPGPEQCGVDDACAIHCATGDRPDPGNMMAYYPDCRVMFSVEQARTMREALALRRGWHPCITGECVCDPAASQCPAEMTCRPFGDGDGASWRCDLDGPAVAGGRCVAGSECGDGSICVQTPNGEGRCARTCGSADLPACTCRPITTPIVSVCGEDLRMRE